MHIILFPVAGAGVVKVRIEADWLTVDDKTYAYDALPAKGPVRIEDGVAIIDYGERGGVSTCCLTEAHEVEVIPSDFRAEPPPPPKEADFEVAAQAELAALRETWVCDRWQIKTVLGRDRWEAIEAFAAGPDAPWGLQTVIADAQIIPRASQTVDLLAFILGVPDDEVDEIFRQAIALRA